MAKRNSDNGFLAEEAFLKTLEFEMGVADREERWYSIVICAPQALPGEGVADIVHVAEECIGKLVRDGDIAGRLEGDLLAVGLPDTGPDGARVFAYRAQGDLRMCSYKLRNTIWEASHATLPEDGETWREVLDAAIASVRTRRQRFAEAPHGAPLPIILPQR
jgi:hypothetical protein